MSTGILQRSLDAALHHPNAFGCVPCAHVKKFLSAIFLGIFGRQFFGKKKTKSKNAGLDHFFARVNFLWDFVGKNDPLSGRVNAASDYLWSILPYIYTDPPSRHRINFRPEMYGVTCSTTRKKSTPSKKILDETFS